jgi:hypothetical protein
MSLRSPTPDELQFVIIAEAGTLERQATLLARSIQVLGPGWDRATIRVVSPRAERRPEAATLRLLDAIGVEYLPLEVPSPCPVYGTSWRMSAMAEVEALAGPDVLVMLDSDTLFLQPPRFALSERGIALRPVDVKGICSAGLDDPLDRYWQQLATLCDVDLDAVPWVETTAGGERVRASHNGGLVVTSRRHGLFARAFEFLQRSAQADLLPRERQDGSFRIGSGHAQDETVRWWGSAQTTLTMAMVSLGLEQCLLPPTYNVPLHIFDPVLALHPQVATDAVHVHYHWVFDADVTLGNELLDGRIAVPETVRALLREHLPLSATSVIPVLAPRDDADD